MANRLQLRKGTTAENKAFKGAVGELTYDTQNKQIRVHDGSTVGGKVVDDPTRDVTNQVSNATETTAGKAKIATTAIAQAGTNDTDIITAKKLAETVFGKGQTIKNVSRQQGVGYTNTTPKLIFVSVRGTPNQQNTTTSISIIVDGVWFSSGGSYGSDGARPFGCIAPVPSGAVWSYSVMLATNISVSELS